MSKNILKYLSTSLGNMSPPHGDLERTSNIRLLLELLFELRKHINNAYVEQMQKDNEACHCVSQVSHFVHFDCKNY